jgi:hypothetical protein
MFQSCPRAFQRLAAVAVVVDDTVSLVYVVVARNQYDGPNEVPPFPTRENNERGSHMSLVHRYIPYWYLGIVGVG